MTEMYLAFDPGFTTGFAWAEFNVEENVLTILDMDPIPLNTRHPTIDMANPPIPCFKDFWERAMDMIVLSGPPDKVYVAIEDFVGGSGGDIQNTVNKLIGILMAAAFGHVDAAPKVYKNSTRLRYKKRVKELFPDHDGISHHSKDALMHLFHRLDAQHPDKFQTMTVRVDLDRDDG